MLPAEVFGDRGDALHSNSNNNNGTTPGQYIPPVSSRFEQPAMIGAPPGSRILPFGGPRTTITTEVTTTATITTMALLAVAENGTELAAGNRNETPTGNCGVNERSGGTTIATSTRTRTVFCGLLDFGFREHEIIDLDCFLVQRLMADARISNSNNQ